MFWQNFIIPCDFPEYFGPFFPVFCSGYPVDNAVANQENRKIAVSEIKVLFGAPRGCISPKTVQPGISTCTLFIFSYNNWLQKRAHTRCIPSKIVHPAMKMCTPGAPLISDTG